MSKFVALVSDKQRQYWIGLPNVSLNEEVSIRSAWSTCHLNLPICTLNNASGDRTALELEGNTT